MNPRRLESETMVSTLATAGATSLPSRVGVCVKGGLRLGTGRGMDGSMGGPPMLAGIEGHAARRAPVTLRAPWRRAKRATRTSSDRSSPDRQPDLVEEGQRPSFALERVADKVAHRGLDLALHGRRE